MLKKIKEEIITFDVDWAPEEAIQYSIDLVLESNSKATFFATHSSEVLKKYVDSDQIEVGIHPNYYKSTNFEHLIDELIEHYPKATSVRAHGLYSSSNIVKLYEKKDLSVVWMSFCLGMRIFSRFGDLELGLYY